MPNVIFVCVANSARSQMAEGLARATAPEGVEVFSAGSQPTSVNPLAVAVMAEIGIDLGGHRSKSLASVPVADADLMVTLCAEEACPTTPASVRRASWAMPDPAAVDGGREEQLAAFRLTRNELARRIEALWIDLETAPSS